MAETPLEEGPTPLDILEVNLEAEVNSEATEAISEATEVTPEGTEEEANTRRKVFYGTTTSHGETHNSESHQLVFNRSHRRGN